MSPRNWVALLNATGASVAELKLLSTFFISYPAAAVLKRLPEKQPHLKNIFSICISLFYLIGIFHMWDGLCTLIVSSAGIYIIAKFLRRSPYMPWVGLCFSMFHMSLSQLRRYRNDSPTTADITGAQMILVIKLSAFCWNVADGMLPESALTDFQRDRRVKEIPDIMDYAGYIFFFPSLMAGPAFDFAEYKRWLDTTMFSQPHVSHNKEETRTTRRIPHSGFPAAHKAIIGIFWIGSFVLLSRYFYPSILLRQSFLDMGFPTRIFFLHMVGFTARLKYYGVWTLTEGACILTGLGYQGIDPVTGRVSWDRLQNINPLLVETAQNSRGYLAGWNMNTNNWLRNYVYLRVTPRGKKPGFRASLLTFMSSALWHGFEPGYYLTFILASLIQTAAKKARRFIRPLFINPSSGLPRPSKKYYDFMSWIVTQLIFSFATAPFLILSLRNSLIVWERLYYYGLVVTLIALVVLSSPVVYFFRLTLSMNKCNHSLSSANTQQLLNQEAISMNEAAPDLPVVPEHTLCETTTPVRAAQVKVKAT